MAVVLLLTMAHTKSTTNNADDVNPTIFHDFLGSNSTPTLPKAAASDARPPSPPASASVGGSSGGGRGPISTTSDLGSERQVGQHFEGVLYYNPRSEFSGPEIGNRFAGSKRSNSDSAFIGSSRDNRFPQMRPENSHLMKMIRSAGGDRPRRAHEDETVFGMHQMRPTSASLILQPATSGRSDPNATKWDRAIPMSSVTPVVQYPPRAAQVVPFSYHQPPSNRFRDANVGPSIVSQAAADEGSRTGIKGSGILSSINAGGGIAADRNPPGGGKLKTGARVSEPESSTPPGRPGLTSSSRQMTIFYGGQAHVFDDVHPNKADAIMALAGSNGGSWSTAYMPKSVGIRPPTTTGENNYVQKNSENETGMAGNPALPREFRGRLSVTGNSSHQFGPDDHRLSIPPPVHQGGIVIKEARGVTQLPEATTEEKQRVV